MERELRYQVCADQEKRLNLLLLLLLLLQLVVKLASVQGAARCLLGSDLSFLFVNEMIASQLLCY